jgi:hypothetical protein
MIDRRPIGESGVASIGIVLTFDDLEARNASLARSECGSSGGHRLLDCDTHAHKFDSGRA